MYRLFYALETQLNMTYTVLELCTQGVVYANLGRNKGDNLKYARYKYCK